MRFGGQMGSPWPLARNSLPCCACETLSCACFLFVSALVYSVSMVLLCLCTIVSTPFSTNFLRKTPTCFFFT